MPGAGCLGPVRGRVQRLTRHPALRDAIGRPVSQWGDAFNTRRGHDDSSDTTAKTVRFYEATALLPPAARTASGYRDFTPPETIARLDFIRRGLAAGLSLARYGKSSTFGMPAAPRANMSKDYSPRDWPV